MSTARAGRARRLPAAFERIGVPVGVGVAVLLGGLIILGGAASHFTSELIAGSGGPGSGFFAADAIEIAYHWWTWAHQLGGFANPYMDPIAYGALVHDVPNQFGWPFAPLFGILAVGGIPFAYNAILLLTFPLTCGATYLWLRSVGLGRPAALCGGLVAAFFPTRVMRLTAHYVAWLVMLVPLALWMAERAARAGTTRARALWSAGFALVLITIVQAGELYFALFAVLITVSYAVLRMRARLVLDRWLWPILGGIVAAVALAFVVRAWLVTGSYWSGGRPISEAALYSPRFRNFFLRDASLGAETFTYLGVLSLAAIPLGIWAGWRRRVVWFWVGWIAVIGIFSLGTATRVFTWLHDHTPFLNFARSVTRPLPLAGVGFALLAAVAVERGLRYAPRARAPLIGAGVALAVGIVAVADASAVGFSSWSVSGLDAQRDLLRGRAGDVLSAPVFDTANTLGSAYMYASTADPRRDANGYSPYTPTEAVARQATLRPVDCGVIGTAQAAALHRYGLRYVVLYPALYGGEGAAISAAFPIAALNRTPGLTPVGVVDGVPAWRLEPGLRGGPGPTLDAAAFGAEPTPATGVQRCGGWSAAAPPGDSAWTLGVPGYVWAKRDPGAPPRRVLLSSGPVANVVRVGPVDGPAQTVRLPRGATAPVVLPAPPDGRWRAYAVDPARSWRPFADGPARYGVRLTILPPP